MRVRPIVVVLALLGALLAPAAAHASELIDRNATDVRLQVNAKDEALLSYTKAGQRKHVLVWGAVNAISPTPSRKQVEFKLDYSGGWGKYRKVLKEGSFPNVCRPYTGPALAWFVTACTAPDGTHWAVQAWQRALPNYGVPASADRTVWELRLSHFDGVLPVLTVQLNWAYRRFDHIFGSFSYKGSPVHGFSSTPAGVPLDTFGRNLYVDTFNSSYGKGWKRENSFLMHKGTGKFCYGFYRHDPHPSGMGKKYRATIIGPGVTPDVMWEGQPLGAYDKSRDLALHEEQRSFYRGDGLCKPV
jgi:hypothetical protein